MVLHADDELNIHSRDIDEQIQFYHGLNRLLHRSHPSETRDRLLRENTMMIEHLEERKLQAQYRAVEEALREVEDESKGGKKRKNARKSKKVRKSARRNW